MPKFDVAATFADHKLAELEEIAAELASMIEAKQLEEIAALKAKAAEIFGKKGYTVEQIFGKPARKQNIVAPKYRNPKTNETWTGRGRKPLWVPEDKVQRDKLLIPASEHAEVAAVLHS